MVNRVNGLGAGYPGKIQPGSRRAGTDFSKILDQKLNIEFSAHANQRMQRRNLNLSDEEMNRLNRAVDQAASKGIRESLILIEDVALIVSVANRKVVTALSGAERQGKVFTNIDGAVIG